MNDRFMNPQRQRFLQERILAEHRIKLLWHKRYCDYPHNFHQNQINEPIANPSNELLVTKESRKDWLTFKTPPIVTEPVK